MALVIPVIHHKDHALSMTQAAAAFACGADGVFVISHHNQDDDVCRVASDIKVQFPQHLVGINLLNTHGVEALRQAIELGLDMAWDDAPGIKGSLASDHAMAIATILKDTPNVACFGSVAFKYQPFDIDPGEAAVTAHQLNMVATTSGSGTGVSPEIGKIAEMRRALNQATGDASAPLAIASGMTEDNILHFLPYITHILIATGVAKNEYELCPEKLKRFIAVVRQTAE